MPEQNRKIIVAEKELYGRYCGQYRIYEKENPTKTLGYTQDLHLPDFLDSCVLSPIYGIHWDCCEVRNPANDSPYTVEFDADYKKELAKDILAKLVALNTGTDIYCGEDVVNECYNKCLFAPNEMAIEDYMMDYLGLGWDYAWIFR